MRLAHSRKCALATVVFLLPTVTLFASNNAISLLGQPNVDFTTYASSTFNTPVTSFSLTGTAAIAYTGLSLPLGQYIPTVTSLVKYCSQSGCSSFYPNINYGTTPLGDMYLAYDEIRGRWIVVGINGQFGVAHQVYYGYSTGGMWTVTQTTLAANYGYSFELPSIAIDSQGRIIIGANLRLTSQSPTDLWILYNRLIKRWGILDGPGAGNDPGVTPQELPSIRVVSSLCYPMVFLIMMSTSRLIASIRVIPLTASHGPGHHS